MSKYRYIPIAGGGGETPVLETLNATQNGQYLPEEGVTGWNEVNIDVPASEVDSGTKQVSINQNGVTTEDVTGYADVEIDVDVQPNLQSKTATQNGLVEPDEGYDGLSDVDVQVPASAVDSGTKQVSKTQNGTTTENVVGYASIEIDVQVPAPYWSGTQAQYDALPSYSNDMLYLIIN